MSYELLLLCDLRRSIYLSNSRIQFPLIHRLNQQTLAAAAAAAAELAAF